MEALNLVKLTPLMERTTGRREIIVGLIDGPVAASHPDLATANVHQVPGRLGRTCTDPAGTACTHGTFVAGILGARRSSVAPAICPDCTLLVRLIFAEMMSGPGQMPRAAPAELAAAIIECADAGTRVLNLSVALAEPSSRSQRELEQALDYAARRGVIAVAAAGNQGTIGSSAITRHPWVIPVVAGDGHGRPLVESNLASSIGRRGLTAPGSSVLSLGAPGRPLRLGGTSVATPFVTGTIALLWSEFPGIKAEGSGVSSVVSCDDTKGRSFPAAALSLPTATRPGSSGSLSKGFFGIPPRYDKVCVRYG